MGSFLKEKKEALENEIALLSEVVGELNSEVTALRTEREERKEVTRLETLVKGLKKQITDLEIQKARIDEDFAREKREIEHQVGLHKKQVAADISNAKREAELKVREENVAAVEDRLQTQLDFITERFQEENDRREGLLIAILERLPTVNVDKAIDVVASSDGREARQRTPKE